MNSFDLLSFIYTNISNKNIMNSIVVKYQNLIPDDIEGVKYLKECINNEDIRNFIKIIYMMPYIKNRELGLYIIEKFNTKEKDFTRKKSAA